MRIFKDFMVVLARKKRRCISLGILLLIIIFNKFTSSYCPDYNWSDQAKTLTFKSLLQYLGLLLVIAR